MHTLSGHFLFVKCVAFSLDSKRVVSASFDKLVKIWNAETGAEVSSHEWCTELVFRQEGK